MELINEGKCRRVPEIKAVGEAAYPDEGFEFQYPGRPPARLKS